MTNILTLKRGSGWTFSGTNWKSVSDKAWEIHVLFIPGFPPGREKHVGSREINGIPVEVFQCLNDDFFAQPVNICELPIPKDSCSTEIFYSLEAPVQEEKKKMTSSVTSTKNEPSTMLTFKGKNWKLASNKKWTKASTLFSIDDSMKVGSRIIGEHTYLIYKSSPGFIAVRQ
jgi:hypothetical protein